VFAILERVQSGPTGLKLGSAQAAPVRKANLNRRTNAAFELAIILLATAWWAAYMDRTVIYLGASIRIALNPQWLWFFWGYLIVLLLTAATAALLARPHVLWLPATLRLFNSICGGVLLCSFLRTGVLAGIEAPNMTAQQAVEFTNTVNHWAIVCFPSASSRPLSSSR